jgi:hypothetical protein
MMLRTAIDTAGINLKHALVISTFIQAIASAFQHQIDTKLLTD